MKNLTLKSSLQMIPGKQWLGILPSWRFWGGKFNAYSTLWPSRWIFFVAFAMGIFVVSPILQRFLGESLLAHVVAGILGWTLTSGLTFGIIEKIVRTQVAKRQALREAEAKKQLSISS